jgi:hypothetical protein
MDSDEKTLDVSTDEDVINTEDTMCLLLMVQYENRLKKVFRFIFVLFLKPFLHFSWLVSTSIVFLNE